MDNARHQVRHEGDVYRRIEVITGQQRRRNWTAAEKAEMVAASAEPGVTVTEVARRYGVNRNLLTTWRRDAGVRGQAGRPKTKPGFVPLIVSADGADEPPAQRRVLGGRIDVMLGDAVIRVEGAVDGPVLETVLMAVRATA